MFDKRKDNNSDSGRQESPVSSTAASAAMGKTALIGPGIHVNGDISGSENLVIEGKVEGKLEFASSQVTIGQSGKVAADIVAKLVKIEGTLQGDVEGKERVVIAKSGKVRGNITAPRVMLEDGAVFKGSIDINPAESAVAELPLPSKQVTEATKPGSAGKDSSYSAKN
jgi:cytoskeletal protein CcmA (bactofilin family)